MDRGPVWSPKDEPYLNRSVPSGRRLGPYADSEPPGFPAVSLQRVCRTLPESRRTKKPQEPETTERIPSQMAQRTARVEVPALEPPCCFPAASSCTKMKQFGVLNAAEIINQHKLTNLQVFHDSKPYIGCFLHSWESDLYLCSGSCTMKHSNSFTIWRSKT